MSPVSLGTSLKLELALSTRERNRRSGRHPLAKIVSNPFTIALSEIPETTRKDPRARFSSQWKGAGRWRGTNGLKATRPLKRRRRNASSMQFFLPIGAISKPAVFPCATPRRGKRKNDPRSFPQRAVNALRAPQSHKETIPSANVAPSAVSSKFQTWSLDSRHALYPPLHVCNTHTHTHTHVYTHVVHTFQRWPRVLTTEPILSFAPLSLDPGREREMIDRSWRKARSYFTTTVPRQIIQWPLGVSVCE